ncbi:uncharacterized protein [Nicotiana tomentosiformis]|uniref:uncharacterized protein n=1 Tax=Nicotiana tomentosiformis TaxID=4098 RepID=UPI00388CAAF8
MRKLCLKKIRGADNSWVEDNKDVAVKAIKVINNEDNDLLEANPTMEEVKDAFFSLSADSAPGPDGISGKFYHHCWDIISADLFDMIRRQLGFSEGWVNLSGDFSQIIELLASLMEQLKNERFIPYFVDRGCPSITHLSYANDTILFSSGHPLSLIAMMGKLSLNERMSGQLVNKTKSCSLVAPNTSQTVIEDIKQNARVTGQNVVIWGQGNPNQSLGKDAVMRPLSGEGETSIPAPKPVKDKKMKKSSPSEDPEPKKKAARKPRKNIILLTEESIRRLREEDEEVEEDDSGLVARVGMSTEALKATKSVKASALHREAFSRSRAELSRCEADLRGLTEEKNALELLCGQKEEEIKDLQAELAKAHQDQTDLIEQLRGMREKSSAQARKIEELVAWLASELAKAKSEAKKSKAEADVIVAVYRADAKASQVQAREAAEIA